MSPPTGYADLGVRPFINCRGNATAIGGSIMPEPVLEAMRQAAGSFVALETLQERIGERLARRIGVEGALVSCGAASGVQQAAAACLTGTDAERVQRLPYTDGWRNRFVIPQVDVHDYIFQVIAAVGGVLVKVGSKESCPTSAIEAALDDDTAAIVHYLGKQTLEQLAEVVAVAEPRGIPVIVDAAAQLPPRSNLTEPVRLGAGLVVFSGGKGLRGPQSSGLVVGKAKLIEAARMNGSPASSVGRGMKVGKEELMGLLAAVELFLDGSDQDDYRRWRADAELIVAGLEGIDGVRATVDDGDQLFFPGGVPRVRIELLGDRTADAYSTPLRDGDPSIFMGGWDGGMFADPMTLQPGEAQQVARRLREVLTLGSRPIQRHPFREIHFKSGDALWDAIAPTKVLFPEPSRLIYRGQGASEWKLIPSVLRPTPDNPVTKSWGGEVKAEEQVFLEIYVLKLFAEYCDRIGTRIPGDSREYREEVLKIDKQSKYTRQPELWPNPDFLELMAIAQHHGVPTRLLDWTRNPYAAVYFAASSAVSRALKSNDTKMLSVWVLDIELAHLFKQLRVVEIPGDASPHLAAQDGLFTAHLHSGRRGEPFNTVGLEEEFAAHSSTPLLKLTTPVSESVRLLELCDKIGFSAATMYPGPDGAGRAVMEGINSWTAKKQVFGK